jgi:hypothetical protein
MGSKREDKFQFLGSLDKNSKSFYHYKFQMRLVALEELWEKMSVDVVVAAKKR